MSQLTITTHHIDTSEVSATVLPVHRVAFERHFKVPFASLRDEPFEERLLWLGWFSQTKGRPNPPTFDAWLETVDHCDYDGGDPEEADPLAETGPSGTSLPAPSSPVPGSPSTD